jgi:hypothetical protein
MTAASFAVSRRALIDSANAIESCGLSHSYALDNMEVFTWIR